MSLIFFLLNVVVGALGAGDYNYDRCDILEGPLFWGIISSTSQCGTVLSPQSEGTPINLCGAVAFSGSAPTFSVSGYTTSRNVTVYNTGSSIYFGIPGVQPTLELGSIASIVGRTTNTTTQTWALQQIHPHWGRTGLVNEGSEHYMQGVAYPMEVHLVHYNTKYGTFSAAVASGAKDALLVVGVFLNIGSTDLNIMSVWADSIPSLTQTAKTLSTQVQVSDFFSGTGDFYSYRGSLTTPGCNEIVTWVVMKDVKTITLATLNKFKNATISPAASARKFSTMATATTYGTFGNYRPIQPLKNRTIFSSNGATAACASYTEAQSTCTTSGAFFSGPSILVQLVAVTLAVIASRG